MVGTACDAILLYHYSRTKGLSVEWLIILFLGLSTGVYYFHFLPSLRRRKLRNLSDCLVKIGGQSDPSWRPLLFNEEQYRVARQHLDLKIFTQLVANRLPAFQDVLERKKSQSLYSDDYGIVRVDAWLRELEYFVSSVLFPLDTSALGDLEEEFVSSPSYLLFANIHNSEIADHWTYFVDSCVAAETRQAHSEFDEFMTGHEYEHYIADLIRELGWTANVTPGSGDHGADVIAERDGTRIAIQCKLYSSPVGNKSVQEAFSAKSFYDCDDACVVTNANFTLAAKKAASKLGVALLHHEDMPAYFTD